MSAATLRRDFLGFTAGAVAARTVLPPAARAEGISVTKTPCPPGALQPLPPVTSPDHPDAALIAACVAAVAVWDRIEAMPDWQEDEVWDALGYEWVDHLEAVAGIRARTAAGCKAKARVLILEMNGNQPGEGDQERRLAWRLAHDVLFGAMA